jgi:hypothetical protein
MHTKSHRKFFKELDVLQQYRNCRDRRWIRIWSLAAAAFALTLDGCVKTDPDSVRTFVTEEIQGQFPEATIDMVGERELAVNHPTGTRQTIDLAPVQEGCKRVPRSCGRSVAQLIVVMQEALLIKEEGVKREKILPLLSSLNPARALVRQGEPAPIVVQSLAENLGVQFAVLGEGMVTYLDNDDLKKLDLPPEKLLKEALRNVEAAARVNTVAFPGEGAVFQVTGWLAGSGALTRVHADKLREQLKCKELAFGFPRRGMTLVANAEDASAVARLREISARFLQPAALVISADVYLLAGDSLALIRK